MQGITPLQLKKNGVKAARSTSIGTDGTDFSDYDFPLSPFYHRGGEDI